MMTEDVGSEIAKALTLFSSRKLTHRLGELANIVFPWEIFSTSD